MCYLLEETFGLKVLARRSASWHYQPSGPSGRPKCRLNTQQKHSREEQRHGLQKYEHKNSPVINKCPPPKAGLWMGRDWLSQFTSTMDIIHHSALGLHTKTQHGDCCPRHTEDMLDPPATHLTGIKCELTGWDEVGVISLIHNWMHFRIDWKTCLI